MGLGIRQHVHGHLIRDDPRRLASIPGVGIERKRHNSWHISGLSEAIALITKTFSGVTSDWIGKRKVLILAGYILGTMTKPLFALAPGVGFVFVERSLDRVGKGIRRTVS